MKCFTARRYESKAAFAHAVPVKGDEGEHRVADIVATDVAFMGHMKLVIKTDSGLALRKLVHPGRPTPRHPRHVGHGRVLLCVTGLTSVRDRACAGRQRLLAEAPRPAGCDRALGEGTLAQELS